MPPKNMAFEFERKRCILLALIFYRGIAHAFEQKQCILLALIFYRGIAHALKNLWQEPDEDELHISIPRRWHRKKKREPGMHVSNFVVLTLANWMVEVRTNLDTCFGSHYPAHL